jgi:hypothetical protein
MMGGYGSFIHVRGLHLTIAFFLSMSAGVSLSKTVTPPKKTASKENCDTKPGVNTLCRVPAQNQNQNLVPSDPIHSVLPKSPKSKLKEADSSAK